MELTARLGRYWCLRASTTEGMRWCETFLDATESDGDPAVGRTALDRARTAALGWWSRLAIGSADLTRIGANLRSMRLARPAAIEPACTFEWLSWTDNLILSLLSVGQGAECADLIADGLRAAEDRRDPYWTCVFLLHRALWRWTSVGQREDRIAFLWAEMAYMAAADNGLFRMAARAMSLTAMNMMARRDWSGARDLMTQSLDGLRRGGDTRSYAVSLNCLGAIMIELNRPREAARHLVEAIAQAKRSDDRLGEIGAAWAVSFLACRLGRHADIAVAHDAVADHLGLLERLLPATVLDDYRLAVADSVTVTGPTAPIGGDGPEVGRDTPAWIWLRGWALNIASGIAAGNASDSALSPAEPPVEQAVTPVRRPRLEVGSPPRGVLAQARGAADSPAPIAVIDPTPAPATRSRPQDLTARELEILAAIASGRTNAQIATDFFLSTKTVMHHSVSIYRKLEVHGRAEAVALAYRTGLLQTPLG